MADGAVKMQLRIITPEKEFFSGDAEFVEFTTVEGDIGIYPRHVPTTVVIAPGVLKIHNNNHCKTQMNLNQFELIPFNDITAIVS